MMLANPSASPYSASQHVLRVSGRVTSSDALQGPLRRRVVAAVPHLISETP